MVTLRHLRGQERAVARLRSAISQGKVAHAYLFTGPAGCGKHSTALALAAALNCDEKPGEACGECPTCTRIDEGNHPDVTTLERTGAAQTVQVSTVRDVIASLALPPHEAHARFFLIEEATSLLGTAANALLKTLEEPPPRTHFILGTSAPERLLPTIRSRCQRIAFGALPADISAELRGDDEQSTRFDELASKLMDATDGAGDIHAVASETASEKGQVAAILGLLASRIHGAAVDAARADQLSTAARRSRQAQLVTRSEQAVATHNAHGQLAIEDLLYRLRRVQP